MTLFFLEISEFFGQPLTLILPQKVHFWTKWDIFGNQWDILEINIFFGNQWDFLKSASFLAIRQWTFQKSPKSTLFLLVLITYLLTICENKWVFEKNCNQKPRIKGSHLQPEHVFLANPMETRGQKAKLPRVSMGLARKIMFCVAPGNKRDRRSWIPVTAHCMWIWF